MNKLIMIVLLSMCLTANANVFKPVETRVTLDMSAVEHAWEDTRGFALFNTGMPSIGVTLWNEYDWGFSVSKGFLGETRENSGGVYSHVAIDLKTLWSFEIKYRYEVIDRTFIFGGIGAYLIPIDHIYYNKAGEVTGGRSDRDDDEGWFYGFEYMINKHANVHARYTKYSKIGCCEYFKGFTVGASYRF